MNKKPSRSNSALRESFSEEFDSDSSLEGALSPKPPAILVWNSPPSPFINKVYIPSNKKELILQQVKKINNQMDPQNKPSLFSQKVENKIYTKQSLQSNKISQMMQKKFSETNKSMIKENEMLLKKYKKPMFTTKAALESLQSVTSSEYFDPKIAMLHPGNNRLKRAKKGVKMFKPGTYEKRAQVFRAKMVEKDLKNVGETVKEEEETDEEFGYFNAESDGNEEKSENKYSNSINSEREIYKNEEQKEFTGFLERLEKKKAQNVEWWDRDLLKKDTYELGPENFVEEMITNYEQHPLPIKPLLVPKPVEAVPLFLTEREKKKARRMKKRAKLEIQAERVRLGLEEAPDPRLSLSNVMRVLANSAVADPSAVERQVRAKIEKRRMKHLLQNEQRRLTPTEKRLKKRRKTSENLSNCVHVAVFSLRSLSDPRVRFKVDVSAGQYGLTGCAVICPWDKKGRSKKIGGIVVVEGGPKGIRKYERLMLRRIVWTGSDETFKGEESTEEESAGEGLGESRSEGNCVCVWKGLVQKRVYKRFHVEVCKTEQLAKNYFKFNKIPQYWSIGVSEEFVYE